MTNKIRLKSHINAKVIGAVCNLAVDEQILKTTNSTYGNDR